MSSTLQTFVAHARSKGMDHQTIRMLLLSAGWKEKDIAAALASESLEMPVPAPADIGSARDAFFHLLAFTTLYSTVISLIILAFEFIARAFPDPAFPVYSTDASAIRWSVAVVIISFPLFSFLSRRLFHECSLHPEKLASGVRRWLTYLTLFVTACTIIGDLVTLLFTLLDGELTARFLLKVFWVFVLSGLPFSYYFLTIRMDAKEYAESAIHKIFFWIAAALTVIAVAWGIFTAGTPSYGRDERFDEVRLNDLRTIESEILNQVYGPNRYPVPPEKVLPKPFPTTLEEAQANAMYQKIQLTDPKTGEPYGYMVHGTSFDLCAAFALVRDQQSDVFWNHPEGYHCFTIDALDPRGR